jgi:hypothetical protein
MQDESSPTVAEQERRVDQGILALLLTPEEQRPWSVDEVGREIGDQVDAIDSLARLQAAGLIHRFGEFVFATRAAVTAERLLL